MCLNLYRTLDLYKVEYLFVWIFMFERMRENMKLVGREVETIWEESGGGKKCDQNIIYEKLFE